MKHVILICFLPFFFTGCFEDDEDATRNPEYPMQSLLDGLIVTNTETNTGFLMEFGYEFRPLENGTIRSFRLNLPVTADYRVTLWDPLTKNTILSTTIAAGAGAYSDSFEISVPVTAMKKYVISVQSEHWSRHTLESNGDFLPRQMGAIEILRYAENVTNQTDRPYAQLFPDLYYADFMQGVVDIGFVPEE